MIAKVEGKRDAKSGICTRALISVILYLCCVMLVHRASERAGWMIVERLDIIVRGGMEKDHGRSMFAF